MSDAQRIPYGVWPSPISADRAAAGSVGLRETRAIGDATVWLERRPQEQGRSVVVRSGPGAKPVDVTPPGVSWALQGRGLPHAYFLFEGEQHGFRKLESISRGLSAELTFYGKILGSEPADRLPPLEIVNLPSGGD
jgi:hypothetical protein